MNKVPCEICGAVERNKPQLAAISEPAKQIIVERGKVLVHLKDMARTFKRGCCNRGLVWATACATIKQAGVFSPGEQQDMLRRWDRLAGFTV